MVRINIKFYFPEKTAFPIIDRLREGTPVYEYDHQNKWSKIDLALKWVHSDYLRFE